MWMAETAQPLALQFATSAKMTALGRRSQRIHTHAAEKGVSTETKEAPLNPPLYRDYIIGL